MTEGGCLRVLVCAPTVDATDVGEAWVAYQWASRLAERHDVTVLTYSKRGRPSARSQLPLGRVIEWQEPRGLGRAERFNSLLKPGYFMYYARAQRWIRAALSRGERFDVGHQVAPVAMRYPTPLSAFDIPYVYGPIGGGLESPAAFRGEEGTAPWYSNLRRLDTWRLRHDPLLRRGFERAGVVLGIAPYVQDHLQGLTLHGFETMGETGIESIPTPVDRTRRQGAVQLLFVGRLVRTKGARDAIRAMAQLSDLDVHLDIVGDGPDRQECEELSAALKITQRVTFHGRQPRSMVDDFYRRADVFVFPSYREPGGNVQFEAMSFGLPLVVSDRGGPAAAVTRECARLVPVTTPSAYAGALADAIRTLVSDPSLRRAMGDASRRHVMTSGLWTSKIDAIEHVYRRVMTASGTVADPLDRLD